MFSFCNLQPALLAHWPGSFVCHCNNTWVEWTLNKTKSQHRKLTLEKKKSPTAPARDWTHDYESIALPTELSQLHASITTVLFALSLQYDSERSASYPIQVSLHFQLAWPVPHLWWPVSFHTRQICQTRIVPAFMAQWKHESHQRQAHQWHWQGIHQRELQTFVSIFLVVGKCWGGV